MELISKEVVRRIIDSGRTKEQILEMVESAVTFEECEDCISREAAISAAKYIFESNSKMKAFCMMKMIEELPPVKPKERTGHWIAVYQGDEIINYRCTECEFGNTFGKSTYRMNYCPNCGAKMIESEDKE